jgi:predicted metal-dependent phosphoesterase TrpH
MTKEELQSEDKRLTAIINSELLHLAAEIQELAFAPEEFEQKDLMNAYHASDRKITNFYCKRYAIREILRGMYGVEE